MRDRGQVVRDVMLGRLKAYVGLVIFIFIHVSFFNYDYDT